MSLGMDMNYICLECSMMAVRMEMSHTTGCASAEHHSQVVTVDCALTMLIEERKQNQDLFLKIGNLFETIYRRLRR